MKRIVRKPGTIRRPGGMKIIRVRGLLADICPRVGIDVHQRGWISQSIGQDLSTITPEIGLAHVRERKEQALGLHIYHVQCPPNTVGNPAPERRGGRRGRCGRLRRVCRRLRWHGCGSRCVSGLPRRRCRRQRRVRWQQGRRRCGLNWFGRHHGRRRCVGRLWGWRFGRRRTGVRG